MHFAIKYLRTCVCSCGRKRLMKIAEDLPQQQNMEGWPLLLLIYYLGKSRHLENKCRISFDCAIAALRHESLRWPKLLRLCSRDKYIICTLLILAHAGWMARGRGHRNKHTDACTAVSYKPVLWCCFPPTLGFVFRDAFFNLSIYFLMRCKDFHGSPHAMSWAIAGDHQIIVFLCRKSRWRIKF